MARRLSLAGFYQQAQPVQPYYAPNSYSPFRRSGEEPPEDEPLPARVIDARGNFSPRGPSASRATFSSRMRVGGFAEVTSSDPVELRSRMEAMIGSLENDWLWIKTKIKAREVAWSYILKVDSYVAGFQTIDGALSMKRKSINDVLGGQLTLDKWINGVNALRQEIYSYAEYVNGSASVKANLDRLGQDLLKTASDYGAKAVSVAQTAAKGLAIATPILLVGVGYLLWKVGLPLLHSYLGGRGAYRGYKLSR